MNVGIALFVVAAIIVAVCLLAKKRQTHCTPEAEGSVDATQVDTPLGFGYKCVWFAIKTDSPQLVAEALGLKGVQPCNWAVGVPAAYEEKGRRVFVSPPVKGWVLAASVYLPTYDGPRFPDRLTPLLQRLGSRFPEVQHFTTHRVVDYHSWTRLVGARLVRSFAYLGERDETLRDVGEQDKVEIEVREADRANFIHRRGEPEADYVYYADEQHVMTIAGSWSIDPTKLGETGSPTSLGLVGTLP